MNSVLYNFVSDLIPYEHLKYRVFDVEEMVRVANKLIWTKVSKAIYIILDDSGFVSYVGSVDRDNSSGLAGRMVEHSKLKNRSQWEKVMILPLEESVKHDQVLRYEGAVARYLRPYDSKKSPNSKLI